MPPSPPPGFTGQRSHVIASAQDGAHTVTLAVYRFPPGDGDPPGPIDVPYVELSESHDGARPGRVMALSTLVHLAQNVGDDEVWQIGGRETPGPRATLPPTMPSLPTLDRLGYAYYLRRRAPDAPTWDRLTPEQQSGELSAVRWVLDTAYGEPGDGAIYAASPGSPPPTEPAP